MLSPPGSLLTHPPIVSPTLLLIWFKLAILSFCSFIFSLATSIWSTLLINTPNASIWSFFSSLVKSLLPFSISYIFTSIASLTLSVSTILALPFIASADDLTIAASICSTSDARSTVSDNESLKSSVYVPVCCTYTFTFSIVLPNFSEMFTVKPMLAAFFCVSAGNVDNMACVLNEVLLKSFIKESTDFKLF